MDVPEDKRTPLRQKPIAHKRDMLISYNYNKPDKVRLIFQSQRSSLT